MCGGHCPSSERVFEERDRNLTGPTSSSEGMGLGTEECRKSRTRRRIGESLLRPKRKSVHQLPSLVQEDSLKSKEISCPYTTRGGWTVVGGVTVRFGTVDK